MGVVLVTIIVLTVVRSVESDNITAYPTAYNSTAEESSNSGLSTVFPCPRGCIGPKGDKGLVGYQGRRGRRGDRGFRGIPASKPDDLLSPLLDYKGEKGDTGRKGFAGYIGAPGPRGEKGDKGFQGQRGTMGRKGYKGLAGRVGLAGTDGDEGFYGSRGYRGLIGLKGEPGEKGFKGIKNWIGLPGVRGRDGDPGEKGLPGPPGPEGIKGMKGAKGIKGLKGDAGVAGERGPKGSSGVKGRNGDKGSKGIPGLPGRNGMSDKGETGPHLETIPIKRDTCTEQLLGQIRYDAEEKALYYCTGRQWLCARHKPCTGVVCLDFFGDKIREGADYYVISTDVYRLASKACIVSLIDSALTDVDDWLPTVTERLDHFLKQKRIGSLNPNHYGIVQFGLAHSPPRFVKSYDETFWVRQEQVGGVLRGMKTVKDVGVSDGYDAMKMALDDLDYPSGCAPFFILVAGKRRAASSQSSMYDSILISLLSKNISVSLIGYTGFTVTLPRGGSLEAFGLDHRGISYVLSSSRRYDTYELGISTRGDSFACEIYRDYGMLALNTKGSVWDINVLERRAVAVDALGGAISSGIIVSEERCQRCICEDDGLGDPVVRCRPHENLQYCQCRSKIGGTVETCEGEDKFTFNSTVVAPFDCSTLQ